MRLTVHAGDGDVELTFGDVRFARLSYAEAVTVARELLETAAGSAAAYGAVEWVKVGDVMEMLGVTRGEASSIVARLPGTHRRRPGGDRYVARCEVEMWAARVLGAKRRKAA